MNSIWIGFDHREADAFAVARFSCRKYLTQPIPINGLVTLELWKKGIYKRPHTVKDGKSWDVISDAPISTEHANARFLVPHLAGTGWALFCDGDILFKSNVARLFENLDPKFAVYCVKHDHVPQYSEKMDGQTQTKYPRKNWTSFIVFNCDHPSNRALTVEMVNTLPGRDLHRLCWLKDEEVGELNQEWNWLVGHSSKFVTPKVVHFTDGTPSMKGYENCAYAEEWRETLRAWAA